ncbi:hypothetical protein ACQKWADRAFT_285044 [Trichoderma austrokoningii]
MGLRASGFSHSASALFLFFFTMTCLFWAPADKLVTARIKIDRPCIRDRKQKEKRETKKYADPAWPGPCSSRGFLHPLFITWSSLFFFFFFCLFGVIGPVDDGFY